MEVLIGTFVTLQKFCGTNIMPELISHDSATIYIRYKAPESLCLLLYKNRIQIKFSYLIYLIPPANNWR